MIPKFRAYHKELKVMYEVLAIDLFNKAVTVKFDKEHYRIYSFDDIILMQSTGLFDKNGVEIFEGDVVNSCGYDSDQGRIYKTTDFTGVIVYRKNSFCLQCGDFLDSWWANDEEVEVIGNVWEDGDLIDCKDAEVD
ncbi:YopX family protein [Streptococcus uberis]|uniref:YopX family protein n=1 Tax=Streptococcus uberis TaxID=1349 RepID=UPI00193AC615|nr:YopX family protein [Streptococcus uberis]